MLSRATVMVVDDEARLRASLAELFVAEGHAVIEAGDGDEALSLLSGKGRVPDVVFLDLKMPKRDGISTLQALMAGVETRAIPVVIVTSFGGSEQTITAMKAGAYDYITKPFEPDEVLRTASRAIEKRRLSLEVERLRGKVEPGKVGEEEPTGLIGRHPSMREVFKLIGKAAGTDATVLVTGESGTGKELVAQALHRHGRRADRELVVVNCAAIPESLLESELFGHERGAFTGAVEAKPGRLEAADGGTLFLDEIGDLPQGLQAKILRALQERTFERVGGKQTRHSDFRLVAATNRDLAQSMAEGRFREDLFYRLDVVRIQVPPLRSRRSDIPELAEHFLHVHSAREGRGPTSIGDDAMRALLLHDFPGNVRELENLIHRAVVLARGSVVTLEDLPELGASATASERSSALGDLLALPLAQATRELEKILIARALARAGGNKAEAARLLQVHRQFLYAKLSELGIE
jgi:two-component system response regulator AtoC